MTFTSSLPSSGQGSLSADAPPGMAIVLHPAVAMLWQAFRLAVDVAADDPHECIWDFAIELCRLRQAGLADEQLRWLILRGYVVHSGPQPSAPLKGHNLQERASGRLPIDDQTLLSLSESGYDLLQRLLSLLSNPSRGRGDTGQSVVAREAFGPATFGPGWDEAADSNQASQYSPAGPGRANKGRPEQLRPRPQWNPHSHELRIDGMLVKRFKWPAVNQEMILAAFEEEGWPRRIDDPLPPQPEQDSKRRLHDTIKCLNRNQSHCLLHFRGDGTGEGIVWESAEATPGSSE
jgi:hypothetical protein